MLKKSLARVKKFLAEEDGPTAIEYMVMVSIVVLFCLMAINAVGNVTQSSFTSSSQAIANAFAD